MTKTLKTAPEPERYVLNELRSCSACNSISAVTVTEPRSQFQLGGFAHQCRGWCGARRLCANLRGYRRALRERHDLVIEIEPEDCNLRSFRGWPKARARNP